MTLCQQKTCNAIFYFLKKKFICVSYCVSNFKSTFMERFTTVTREVFSDQVLIRYPCFYSFKLFIFNLWFKLFSSKKTTVIAPTFLIILRFLGYRCKSGMDIFAWRFTLITITAVPLGLNLKFSNQQQLCLIRNELDIHVLLSLN